jgi:hypothetical protein
MILVQGNNRSGSIGRFFTAPHPPLTYGCPRIRLFAVVEALSSSVLYIIITKAMETIHNISSTKTRVSLIVVGIVTALICIVALLSENETFNSLRTLNLISHSFSVKLISKITVSIWPF